MANPRPKSFAPHHRDILVKALGQCRNTCTDQMRHMPLGSNGDVYRATQTFLERLDDFVGALTGDRQRFWLDLQGPTSSKPTPPAEE